MSNFSIFINIVYSSSKKLKYEDSFGFQRTADGEMRLERYCYTSFPDGKLEAAAEKLK